MAIEFDYRMSHEVLSLVEARVDKLSDKELLKLSKAIDVPKKLSRSREHYLGSCSQMTVTIYLSISFRQFNVKATPQNKVAQQLVYLHRNLRWYDTFSLNSLKVRLGFFLICSGF